MLQAILGFLKALPALVELGMRVADGLEKIGEEVKKARLEANIREARKLSKEIHDQRKYEELLGRLQ